MPQLNHRGLELVWELSSAADHLDQVGHEELRSLLREASDVLADCSAETFPNKRIEPFGKAGLGCHDLVKFGKVPDIE